jgi:hypothetical protein
MAIKSIVQLLAQADATIEDNNTQNITAADVRAMFKDFLDTMGPGYGVLVTPGTFPKACTAAPSIISPFTAVDEVTAGYFSASAANGQIDRLIASAGIAGATNFVTFTGSVNGPNNSNLTVEIYRDGVATGIKTSVTCTGLTDDVGLNMVGLDYKAGADAVFEIRASSIPNGNHNFSNMQFLIQSQPVRAY